MSINVQAESVAADMDRIFGPLADRPAPTVASRDLVIVGGGRRRSRWLMFGAPVLVLIAGTALGVTYARDDWRPQMVSARSATPADYRISGSDTARPATGGTVAGPAEPDVGAGDGAGAGDTLAVDVPDPVGQAAGDPGLAATASTRAAADPRAPARIASDATRASAGIDRAARPASARRGGDTATILPGCVPGSLEDRCIYQDVLNADGRLRRAFERARQDGVANRDLTAISRRWRQARDLASDDPDGTIRRYDQLADTLDDLRRDAGE